MEDQRYEQEVERIDLADRRRRPNRPDRTERERSRGGDRRPRAQPLGDDGDRRERHGDEHRRQQVRPERDAADGDELGDPREKDVRRVARRVGDAENVGDGLHLAPVAEGDSRHEGPEVDGERNRPDDRWSKAHLAHATVPTAAAGFTHWCQYAIALLSPGRG